MSFTQKLRKLKSVGFRGAVKIIMGKLLRRLLLGTRSLFGDRFAFFEQFDIHVLPVHYYSPVPDTRELRRDLSRWYREWSFSGVDFNVEEQVRLLNSLRAYKPECDNLSPYQQIASQGFGQGYGEVESHLLHAMIRHFKPHAIIEVGSGISTCFSVNALSLNKQENGIDSKMICIEPYPRSALYKLQGDCEIQIVPKPVQDIEVDFFKTLDKGDILFIDSSHVVKINSDVNYLYLEVLPNLKAGVIIHIHDICFPYPTPDPEDWMFTRHLLSWMEAALVQAFLAYNSAFKILLCSSYLHYKSPQNLGSVFSIYDPKKHLPSSLWLQKVH